MVAVAEVFAAVVAVVAAAAVVLVVKPLLFLLVISWVEGSPFLRLVSSCHQCWHHSITQAQEHFLKVHLQPHPKFDRVFFVQAFR